MCSEVRPYVFRMLLRLVVLHGGLRDADCPQLVPVLVGRLLHHALQTWIDSLNLIETMATNGALQIRAELMFVENALGSFATSEHSALLRQIFDKLHRISETTMPTTMPTSQRSIGSNDMLILTLLQYPIEQIKANGS